MSVLLPSFNIAGQTAIITGASSGIGRHIAMTLAKCGVSVVVAARRTEKLDSLVQEIKNQNGIAYSVPLDVTKKESVDRAVEESISKLGGKITILVNNAGIALEKPAFKQTESDWDSVVDTDLKGAWLMAQAVGKHMSTQKGGSIINICSIVGLRVVKGLPSYAASKAGLIHLTKSLANEWAKYNIRVNAICPGYISTEMNASFWETEPGKEMIKRIPQRRLGKEEDLDGAIVFLASPASSYITGSTIVIDGGHLTSSL